MIHCPDLSLMIKFINGFLNQSHQFLYEFYEEFMRDIVIQIKVKENKNIYVNMNIM